MPLVPGSSGERSAGGASQRDEVQASREVGGEGAERARVLTWNQRMKIAVDVARGLQHLHEKADKQVGGRRNGGEDRGKEPL